VPEFLEVVVNDVSVVNELISMSHKIPWINLKLLF
jgi:hypothetical protein